MSLLSIQSVSAGYNHGHIVKDVSFEINAGEFCALLGLNGSGKTTLFKAICGLIPLKNGIIKVNDTDISTLDEKKRARYISYIPQRHSPLGGVSVTDAVLMGLNASLGIFDTPSKTDIINVHKALDKMGIAHLSDKDFASLSEGQKQLVILTRTFVQNTPVMLMDEPDSALDFTGKHIILAKIRDLVHNESKAGLITLHDPNPALRYCDRLILINDGMIISQINIHSSSIDDIEQCLKLIYNDIIVTKQNEMLSVQCLTGL